MTTPSEPLTTAGRRALALGVDPDVILGIEADARAPLARDITQLRKDLAIEAEARAPLEAEIKRLRRLLNYLWDEADVEPGQTKVCDLFAADDSLALDIASALEPSDG